MTNVPFTPPPGFVADDTKFLATGSWRGGSLVRFHEGQWQVRGGWERLMLDKVNGVCRNAFSWTDAKSVVNIAFGTHKTLEVWQSGAHADITPPSSVTFSTALHSTNGNPNFAVEEPGHTRQVGDVVTISGAPAFAGVANPNGTFTILFSNPGSWVYNTGTNATATLISAAFNITVAGAFVPGQIDGTGGSGYSTGAYGVGNYSEPSTADYFPLTWSFGAFGEWLISNPRNRGVYIWKNNYAAKAVVLVGAPARVTYMLCLPQRQVMCFGCNEEVSGVFNPLAIRWSDIENIEGIPAWTTSSNNNAGEYILEGGSRIVTARRIGDYVFVWTDTGLYLGTFLGSPDQTWKFELIAENCGAIGPNVPVVTNQRAAWISPDRQFWSCALGGVPSIMDCPIWSEFKDHVSQGQDDKIVASTISTYREVIWLYPDNRDGLENSREITVGANGWYLGMLARTAAIDAGPTVFPVKVDAAGNCYWHEKGQSADGGSLAGYIESNDFYIAEAEGGVLLSGCWPDIKDQIGPFKLTLYTRENPQAIERSHGPWALAPGQSRRSFRVSGRLARIRLDFDSAPAYGRGGKFEFETAPLGGR